MPGCRVKPRPPLDALVVCLWYWEGAPGPHLQERLLPNAEASVVFNLRDEPIVEYEDDGGMRRYGHAAISGARSNCFTIDCNQQERVIGIQFQPGGAFPFFPMPISELEDASFAMADLWGEEAGWMRERVLAAGSPRAMLQRLEVCLRERLRLDAARRATPRLERLHPAVRHVATELDRYGSTQTVAEVTEQVGLSQRRVAQLFHEQVGVSPKTFQRVRRFQHTLRRIAGQRSVDWADVALECGYYDQAHLSHDFRRLAGMTPGTYLERATVHMNHVPLTD